MEEVITVVTNEDLVANDILVVGKLYEPASTPEGSPTLLPGFHVNSAQEVVGWGAYKVFPSNPKGAFAGVVTHYYSFADEAEFRALVEAEGYETVAVRHVPAQVTRRQARQALLLSNKLHLVQVAIDAIPNATQKAMVQIEWEDSLNFERNRPTLIALATALGMTSADLDDLFVTAAGL